MPHPIGLIQREYFDRGEVDRPPPQMIDETAGRRNDDVCAASQRLNLPAHTDTTEDGDEAKTRGRSVRPTAPDAPVRLIPSRLGARQDYVVE